MLAIRLPQDIEHRLQFLSKKTGRTKTYYVREAILNHLTDLEDYYLAEERMATHSKSQRRSLDDLLRELNE